MLRPSLYQKHVRQTPGCIKTELVGTYGEGGELGGRSGRLGLLVQDLLSIIGMSRAGQQGGGRDSSSSVEPHDGTVSVETRMYRTQATSFTKLLMVGREKKKEKG